MGIPYYFYSLTQKYNNILSNRLSVVPDTYCIDFNGLIHPVAHDIISKKASNIHECILNALWDKIIHYMLTSQAKKIIICADGVAPLAKMVQQRKRRYLTVYKNKLDSIQSAWDTNAITPGTQFMEELNSFMKKQIRYSKHNVEFVYSGSDENGEGEHKIFDKLVSEADDANIIIHGLDADLIILSLISHKKNIYLMRESSDQHTGTAVCNYLNVQNLRRAIIKELAISWDIANILKIQLSDIEDIYSPICNDLIESYCMACSILGNDFIPHLATVDLKTNGLDKLMKATKYAIANSGLLVKDGAIQQACLSYILSDLSKTEDADMHHECEKYIKKRVHETANLSDMYAIKHRDPVANNIYNNPTKWRHEYYKGLFDCNITLSSTVVFNACENYIKGVYWIHAYYKKYELDYNWYYPYNYAPSIKDIANHSIANNPPVISKIGSFVPSYIQLLIVLPKESKCLMKKEHQKYMDDIYAGLYHMYPEKYKIQTFLKTHLWECSPKLPTINLKYIERVLVS
jgi:5'-3' exonuclease